MIKSNSKAAKQAIRNFILNTAFDGSNYGIETPATFSEAARLIWAEFVKCKSNDDYFRGWSNSAIFDNWAQGLPSILNGAPYYLYYSADPVQIIADILQETPAEAERYTPEQAAALLSRLIYREITAVI